MDMKKIPGLLFLLLFLTGCAKLTHLQELLTLKDLSEDRDQQDKYVRNHDEKFEWLCSTIKNNFVQQFRDKKSFLKEFGKPILTKSVVLREEPMEMWLYRYATQSLGSPKIYVYFTNSGYLKGWQYFPRDNESDPHEFFFDDPSK